jgi:hypothetical protein
MRRTRSGKRLELTTRDFEIFKLLREYRYLRSTYLHAFVGGASVTRFKERLGDLFHEGHLDRPGEQWEYADARNQPAVYQSGAGAKRLVDRAEDAASESRTFLMGACHRQFRHALLICEVLASIDLGIRASTNLRLIGWPEILDRAPDATRSSPTPFRIPVPSGGHLVPDGLFGVEYAQGSTRAYRFFALEADRGTMPLARSGAGQTSYLGKLTAYREIVEQRAYKTHLGISSFLILTVTTSEARATEMLRRFDGTGSGAAFLFESVGPDELRQPMPGLLVEPWQRAGLPPLCIGAAD